MTDQELLQFAYENGIINIADVQEQYEMKKRQELLDMHPYAISQGKDGKWRTYLPDAEKDSGRRMVKKSSKKDIENVVIEYYRKSEVKAAHKTFDDMYCHWRSVQDLLVTDNTVSKYNTDYKRYFDGSDFSKKRIDQISEEDVKVFMCTTVNSLQLCKKACKTLFGYIRNVMKSAVINKVITDDPTKFLEAKQFYKYCIVKKKPIEKCVVSDDDMKKLYAQFYDDYKKQPSYIPTYAVHLATLTGMRVGEISALTWDCITDKYIIIDKSEKYNRLTKEYFIDKTKNGVNRIFPITDEIRMLLTSVKKAEIKNNYLCQWVFANENGRVHAPVISSCSKNKCRQLGITEKGIHAYRRTINSKMRCEGVSSTVAAALLGHTEQVNEMYYTFDISSIEEKAKIISKINSETIIAN